ncbi:ferritin-like domain-containing protein [Exophiala viscosa]|uniref:ferritin-like domain-containing protein n=1 Tax=Exophiala viscosa TaxID=2486360 RepID=UPI00219D7513|nr:ferritin-like domain-containing protein [Exophiala viscosa]
MKSSSIAASVLWACGALAAPAGLSPRQTTNIDTTVLQFALTLEHLENAFYHGAINNFTEQDFMDAGYSATYYNNLKYISVDEQSHVQLLSSALTAAGVTPNAACSYKFPYTDVKSFITLSSVLEGVGVSAYLGGAPLITSKAYLTVAGSILVTEALHTSYQRANIGEVPMANPYGTPLDPTSVYTLAAMFITSCPASNAALPFTAFPTLTYDSTASCWGGESIKLTGAKDIPAGSYVTFISGLSVVSVQGTISGADIMVEVPAVAMGQTYVFITSKDIEGTFVDANVVFGPAIIEVAPPAPVINDSIV